MPRSTTSQNQRLNQQRNEKQQRRRSAYRHSGLVHWSGTEIAPGINAWDFLPVSALLGFDVESLRLHAVAVRPGDAATSVPEPQTLELALLALGATWAVQRRRR